MCVIMSATWGVHADISRDVQQWKRLQKLSRHWETQLEGTLTRTQLERRRPQREGSACTPRHCKGQNLPWNIDFTGGKHHRCFHGATEWTVWMDVSVQVGIRPLIKWPSAAQEASFLCSSFLLRGTFAEVDIILLTDSQHVWTFRFGASRVKGWFSVLYY